MSSFPYRLTGQIGTHTLGLIVLQVDETVEQDMRRLFASSEVALYVTRVSSGDELNPDTIAAMETFLPTAAGLLPPAARFDAIGYACTSGTAQIGADSVAKLISGHATTKAVTDPLTAAINAFRALSVRRLAIVSPYTPPVAAPICRAFEAAGIEVVETLSFGEEVEARVARIDPASIRDAALHIGQKEHVDGVFLSCTNLRTLDIIDDLEAELGRPVVSSNQALAWHMGRLSGLKPGPALPGKLGKTVLSY
jgi:maleate isomerase